MNTRMTPPGQAGQGASGTYNPGRQLHFLSPDASAFLEVVRPFFTNASRDVHLIGDNQLADAIAAAAAAGGITVERDRNLVMDERTGRQLLIFTETDGAKLGAQLLSCVDMDDVVILAPVTDWHFSKKPLFLISIPKAGTHMLYALAGALGYEAGIHLPEFPKGQTWYCVEYSNSHTSADDFFVDSVRRAPFGNRYHAFMRSPALFIYRHPLDVLVSEAHYYHLDGKTAFAGWLDRLDFNERVMRLLRDKWLIGSLRDRIGGFLPWMDFPNVIPLSFEELVGASGGGDGNVQSRLVWSVQLKLQVPGNPDDIASRIFNPGSETFRSGKIGSYADVLPPRIIDEFVSGNGDILQRLGYDPNGAPGFPRHGDSYRRRPVIYSRADFSSMPLLVQENFLGCNLVRYENRIYAVPIAAGKIMLDKLPPATLAELPSAGSVSELRALLLIGHSALSQHKRALEDLAGILGGNAVASRSHPYWKQAVAMQIRGNSEDRAAVERTGRQGGGRDRMLTRLSRNLRKLFGWKN